MTESSEPKRVWNFMSKFDHASWLHTHSIKISRKGIKGYQIFSFTDEDLQIIDQEEPIDGFNLEESTGNACPIDSYEAYYLELMACKASSRFVYHFFKDDIDTLRSIIHRSSTNDMMLDRIAYVTKQGDMSFIGELEDRERTSLEITHNLEESFAKHEHEVSAKTARNAVIYGRDWAIEYCLLNRGDRTEIVEVLVTESVKAKNGRYIEYFAELTRGTLIKGVFYGSVSEAILTGDPNILLFVLQVKLGVVRFPLHIRHLNIIYHRKNLNHDDPNYVDYDDINSIIDICVDNAHMEVLSECFSSAMYGNNVPLMSKLEKRDIINLGKTDLKKYCWENYCQETADYLLSTFPHDKNVVDILGDHKKTNATKMRMIIEEEMDKIKITERDFDTFTRENGNPAGVTYADILALD